jgi:hypothetical protein
MWMTCIFVLKHCSALFSMNGRLPLKLAFQSRAQGP